MKRANGSLAISLLALFISLSGASYAALKLPRNSVGSKQIKREAVTRQKIAPGAVSGNQLASDSVSGLEVADGSLSGIDLAPGTIPPNLTAVVHTVLGPRMPVCAATLSCAVQGSTATCPTGERVVAGGADNFTGGTVGEYSVPTTDRTAWIAGVANGSDYNGGWVQAYAVCAPTGRAVQSGARPTALARREADRALLRLRETRP